MARVIEGDNGRLTALDGLRGFAALGVLLMHVGQHLPGALPFPHGYVAVPFFFVLSGFVVARTYEPRLATSLTLGRFMAVRLVRLLPMAWLSALLSYLVTGDGAGACLAMLVLPVFWTHSLFFPLNPPEWSLVFELIGNVTHGMLVRLNWLGRATLGLAVAASAVGLYLVVRRFQIVGVGFASWNGLGGVPVFVACYTIGIAIARMERVGRLPRVNAPFVLLALVLGLMLWIHPPMGTRTGRLFDVACALLLSPALVIAGRSCQVGRVAGRVCKRMGDLSYPLYLIHFPLVTLAATHVPVVGGAVRVGEGLGLCALVLLAAALAERFYDEPVRQALSRAIHARFRQPSAGPA